MLVVVVLIKLLIRISGGCCGRRRAKLMMVMHESKGLFQLLNLIVPMCWLMLVLTLNGKLVVVVVIQLILFVWIEFI